MNGGARAEFEIEYLLANDYNVCCTQVNKSVRSETPREKRVFVFPVQREALVVGKRALYRRRRENINNEITVVGSRSDSARLDP